MPGATPEEHADQAVEEYRKWIAGNGVTTVLADSTLRAIVRRHVANAVLNAYADALTDLRDHVAEDPGASVRDAYDGAQRTLRARWDKVRDHGRDPELGGPQ